MSDNDKILNLSRALGLILMKSYDPTVRFIARAALDGWSTEELCDWVNRHLSK